MHAAKSSTTTRTAARSASQTAAVPADEKRDAIERARKEAAFLEEQCAAVGLRVAMGIDPDDMSILGVRLYMLRITNGIKDPVEKMLVQQFTLAHHRLVQLHGQASDAQGLEAVKVFNAAAARLQGELRRLALAIRQYRMPAGQKSFSVVHQQNVVSGGDQNVQYVDMGKGKESLRSHDELRGKLDPLQERIHGTSLDNGEEPATRTGGQTDRRQAAAVVA